MRGHCLVLTARRLASVRGVFLISAIVGLLALAAVLAWGGRAGAATGHVNVASTAVIKPIPVPATHATAAAKPAAATTGTYAVNLGYADSLRPNPINFPTPWQGAPGVVYEGCTPSSSCQFDGGAVEIINKSAKKEKVGSVVITFATDCVYNIWPHTITLPKGDVLIITELAGGGPGGCTVSTLQMDSSDIGPTGVNWAGNCNQSHVFAQISVTVNGNTTVYNDSTQILNTGGVDANSCGHPNESEQWTPIGHTVCYGASLTLTPTTKTVLPGSVVDYTAKLVNSCGNPLQDAPVTLSITKGPGSGTTSTVTTNATGTAKFALTTSATQGIDFIQASTTNPGGEITSKAAILYNQKATVLTLTPKAALPGSTVSFTGSGFGASETVHLYGNTTTGTTLATVTSNATGKISGSFVVPAPTASAGALSEVVADGATSGKQAWALFSSTCTDDWAGAVNGNWSTAKDWSTGATPGSNDTACIIVPGTYKVTLNNSWTVNSLILGTTATTSPGTQTLDVQAAAAGGVTLAATAGTTIEKHGTFLLDSLDADNGSIIRGGPISNAGTFTTVAGAGSWRYLRANLTNMKGATANFDAPITYQDSTTTTTNDGTLNIGSGAELTLTGNSVFNQAAGTFTNSGTLYVNGAIYDANGGTESGNAVVLQSSTFNDSAGGGSYLTQCGNTLTGDIPAGQTVTAQANGCGTSSLNLSGTVDNHGTLNLDSTDADNSTYLQGSGTLTNDGTIHFLQDAGGNRYLRVALTNNADGTVTVGSVVTNQDSNTATVNNGTFTISSGAQLNVTGGSSVFNQAGGTLTDSGTLYVNGSTYDANGGTESANAVVLQSTTFHDTAGGGSYVTQCGDTLTGNIPAGQTVTAQGNGCGPSTLTLSGTVDNQGTLKLDSIDADNYALVQGGTLTNDGTIDFLQDAGGSRYLRSNLTNNADGTVTVGSAVTNQDSNTATVNNGTFTISSGAQLNVSGGSSVFNQAGGTLTDSGTLYVNGSSYDANGGAESGNAVVLQSTTFNDTAGTGSYLTQCSDTLTGNIPAGQTVTVQANGCGPATLNLSGTVDNHGTLNVSSIDGDNNAVLQGGTLTNDGTLSYQQGTGGGRYLRSNLTNNADGTVTIGSAVTNQDSGTTTVNDGTFTVTPGAQLNLYNGSSVFKLAGGTLTDSGTLYVDGSVYDAVGGTESGNPVVLQSSTFNDTAGGGSYLLQCTNNLNGTVPKGQTVNGEANGCGSSTTNLAAGGVTNKGTIELSSLSADGYSLVDGGLLTNKGTFETLAGNGGTEYVRVNVVNDAGATVSILGANARQDSSTSITNAGTFKLGDGVTYTITGGSSFSETTGATYGVTVDTSGTSSLMTGGGSVSVTGTLAVTTVGTPTTGEGFVPVSGTAFGGTFSTVSSGTHTYGVSYSSSGFTLTAT